MDSPEPEVLRLVIVSVNWTSSLNSVDVIKDQEIFSEPGPMAMADSSVGGGGGPVHMIIE